ncbi:hypothetical protein OC835_005510 [Tilletia horrida]|nr:hypothetical protein OC835_005510 [Tilletia horrida]
MQTTSYGGTAMAPSPSSPGVIGLVPSSLNGQQTPAFAATPLSQSDDGEAAGHVTDSAPSSAAGPAPLDSAQDRHQNGASSAAGAPSSSTPETPSAEAANAASEQGPDAGSTASSTASDSTLGFSTDADPPSSPSPNDASPFELNAAGNGSDATPQAAQKAEESAQRQLASVSSDPISHEAGSAGTPAASNSASEPASNGGSTISPSTGASIAAALSSASASASSASAAVNTSAPASGSPAPPGPPPSSIPTSSSPASSSSSAATAVASSSSSSAAATAANQRLVYPALHLFPLNGTFVPKCINLSPPGPHNRVKIGRQTTPKTAPNPTNGFFDSKVLSRAHAEIWSRDGKIYIKDVKSSNGTFINGERLSAEAQESDDFELHSEDHVEFGIDIVSEDGKVVLHHKVACRVYVVITAEDAVNLRQDVANGYIGGAPSAVGIRNGPAGGAGGAGGAAAGAGVGGVDGGRGGGGLTSARGGGHPGMGMGGSYKDASSLGMSFGGVLNRLQSELKRSREAGQELTTIANVFSDIHDTLAGGLPPLPQPPYQHLVPEAEDKSQPNRAAQVNEEAANKGPSAAESEAAAAAAAANEAAAAAATKAKEEAEAKLAATTAQAAEQAQTVNQLQSQLSETQASLAEHIAKMRGLEEMLVEHEHLKGEVDALRRLVADVSSSSSSSSTSSSGGGNSASANGGSRSKDTNGPSALGRIPPPPLPPLPSDASAPPPSLFNSTTPLPPAPHRTGDEQELELFDAFKARASRKTPAMLAEEEERMRVLDQREREVDEELRRLRQHQPDQPPLRSLGDDAVVDPLLGSGDHEHEGGAAAAVAADDFDDGASVASVDTVVPGSPPPAPAPGSLRLAGDEDGNDRRTLGDAPKPPAGMDEVEGGAGAGAGGLSVPMRRRKREESSPGLLQLADATSSSSRSAAARSANGPDSPWSTMRVGDFGSGRHGAAADDDDDDDDDDDEDGGEFRKNGHVGPLAPPDMPPGMSYDGLAHDMGWSSNSSSHQQGGRMTRAQLLEENAKLQARLASLEELLSEAIALGRSLSREVEAASANVQAQQSLLAASPRGQDEGLATADGADSDNGEKDGQRAAKVEPVDPSLPSSDAASSEEDSKHTSASAASSDSTAAATGVVDMDAHVRQLEARIASLESEMDRRVAEVESEILRETQAKWELWRAQAEQGMELERASWERDHGRIFRKVVEQQEQQKQKKQSQASKAGSKHGAGGSGNNGADGGDNDEEEEEEQSARSASSGGTGDTDLSSNSGASAASTNATSPPSSIAESVGRFGKSLLGSTSSTSSSPSRSTKLGSGVVGRTEDGEDEDEKRALGAAGGGPGAVGPGRAGSSKPFLFSDNSAAVPALSAAGAVIVAMAVMAFAAKSAGPHK